MCVKPLSHVRLCASTMSPVSPVPPCLLWVTLAREESPPMSVRSKTPLVQKVRRVLGDSLGR